MKPSSLTRWGEFLLYIRGLSGGLMLSAAIAQEVGVMPALVGCCGLLASVLLTPILRLLGWRRLAERVEDVRTAPCVGEVESGLRASIGEGLSLQEAVRFLHQNRGWDVMDLSPAVATVGDLSPKEAIRLVMSVTILSGSGSGSQAG